MTIVCDVYAWYIDLRERTLLDTWEPKQLDKSKVIAGDDGLLVKGSVHSVDVIHLGVLWPDAVDL